MGFAQFDVSFLFAETLHLYKYLVLVANIYDEAGLATLSHTNDSIWRDQGGNPVSEKVFEVSSNHCFVVTSFPG